MAPAREILDSEDEGSDFSPVKAGGGGAVYENDGAAAADDETEPRPRDGGTTNGTNSSSLKSTDPEFFERVYNEQRAAVAGTSRGEEDMVDYLRLSGEGDEREQEQEHNKGLSSLTSVTDPAPPAGSRKVKRAFQSRREEDMDDPTQVTTPSRGEIGLVPAGAPPTQSPISLLLPSSSKDSGSGVKSLSKAARTYGKRKRESRMAGEEQSSMPSTLDPYDFPSTAADQPPSSGRAKRVKRGAAISSSPGGGGLQAMDTGLGGSSGTGYESTIPNTDTAQLGIYTTPSTGYQSTIPNTDTPQLGLYLAPSALTASQKMEYQFVAPSSGFEPVAGELGLPTATGLDGDGLVQKSSGATTIPYSTPSRFGSSAATRRVSSQKDGLTGVYEVDEGESPGHVGVGTHPASSPDVIVGEPGTGSGKGKKKRGRPAVKASQDVYEVLGPPLETRSAKKRRVSSSNGVESVDDVLRDHLQEAGLEREDGAAVDEGHTNNEGQNSAATSSLSGRQAAEMPPEPKKRGRKRKQPNEQVQEPIDDNNPDEAHINTIQEALQEPTELAQTEEPAPKKRRGRPRKSAVQAVASPDTPDPKNPNDPAESISHDVKPSSTAKPGKRGRKKKEPITPVEVPEHEEEDGKHLSERSSNSQAHPTSKKGNRKGEIDASDGENDGDLEDEEEKSPVKSEETKTVLGVPPPVTKTEDKGEDKKLAAVKVTAATPSGGIKSQGQGQGTARYRVGLSKRTRIAPLLKCLKK
ncbi:hypothetical protein QBC47DRAFT_369616 [Echria macrotheca]|uniref:AT hook domain-containing protein n=1 Tax=Echria macrotheca TaxID=438768 RepID=A0AAJ0BQ15_9PEZI|nr:hypothetical protein QBC47DRAFT_369616 [Echria macrotheca]